MKLSVIVSLALAAAGLALGVYAFLINSSPYVSAKEAIAKPGAKVHVAGSIAHDTVNYSIQTNTLTFVLVDDDGTRLKVSYSGPKPGNFDSAPKASVGGFAKGGEFIATDIKTQCPSKYEAEKK